jgi:phosphoribosylformylglycinamidine synthase
VLAVADAAPLLAEAAAAGVPAARLGRSGGPDLVLPGLVPSGGQSISVAMLADAHEATLPALMA